MDCSGWPSQAGSNTLASLISAGTNPSGLACEAYPTASIVSYCSTPGLTGQAAQVRTTFLILTGLSPSDNVENTGFLLKSAARTHVGFILKGIAPPLPGSPRAGDFALPAEEFCSCPMVAQTRLILQALQYHQRAGNPHHSRGGWKADCPISPPAAAGSSFFRRALPGQPHRGVRSRFLRRLNRGKTGPNHRPTEGRQAPDDG